MVKNSMSFKLLGFLFPSSTQPPRNHKLAKQARVFPLPLSSTQPSGKAETKKKPVFDELKSLKFDSHHNKQKIPIFSRVAVIRSILLKPPGNDWIIVALIVSEQIKQKPDIDIGPNNHRQA